MKDYLKSKKTLFFIFIIAAFFRLYGLNWDQNQHLHPDERFLTMVTQAVKFPNINPYEAGYNFFVYGTLPVTIVKAVSSFVIIDKFDYNNITLVGRIVSAFFDLGVIILVYKIAKNVFDKKIALFAGFFYSISVLPIQLSHFYATDTFANFFAVLTFYFLVLLTKQEKLNIFLATLLGISFGLSIASKISSLLFLPVIGLGFLYYFIRTKRFKPIAYCLLPIAFAFWTVRIFDPHVFTSQFVDNLKQLKSFDNPNGYFPPAIQWITTKPLIFPLKNMILWGFGLPLGLLTIFGVVYLTMLLIKQLKKSKSLSVQQFSSFLILFWILFLFFYQGIQFAKPMRYFLPIYPFLAILAANLFDKIMQKYNSYILHLTSYILLLIYPLSFLAIYSRPHSRIMASEWIYKNIPAGAVISCEHWDDCLPLTLGQKNSSNYKTITLTLFDPDTPDKWTKVKSQLNNVDYLIMSSNRLWGSIPKVPEKYPITSKFYSDLFNEKLQFKKVTEIASYAAIPILNIPISDDSADESFTVYDHPKIIIFKSINPF